MSSAGLIDAGIDARATELLARHARAAHTVETIRGGIAQDLHRPGRDTRRPPGTGASASGISRRRFRWGFEKQQVVLVPEGKEKAGEIPVTYDELAHDVEKAGGTIPCR